MGERDPSEYPVGEGPAYAVMRAEARKIIPWFVPGGGRPSGYGLGTLGSLYSMEDGRHELSIWTRESGYVRLPQSLEDLRATAIAMLVYCEAVDASSDQRATPAAPGEQ